MEDISIDIKEWLGENNSLGIDIFNGKYRHNNESFDESLNRIANGNIVLRKLIANQEFLPAGRILANRGLQYDNLKVTFSNCYVIKAPDDNIESIFDCNKKLARTFSYGGGCGIDIGKLRPRGADVNNAAKTTSGAVSFMDLFSQTTEIIGQKGRRGALMISIPCNHPDIEEFIKVKSNLDRITKANISIRVSDDFMCAVKNNLEYELYFDLEDGNRISKSVEAKELFKLLAEMNHNNAEPGLLFWDRITQWNLLSEDDRFEYAGVNPCISGESLIPTINGYKQIKDLVGQKPYVYCMNSDGELDIQQASKVWMTRKLAQTVTVKTGKGEIKCTPDHLIFTTNRGWVSASNLQRGDKIKGLNRSMCGEKYVGVCLSGAKKYIKEHRFVATKHYRNFNIDYYDVHHKDGNTLNNDIQNLELIEHSKHSAISNTGRQIDVLRDGCGRYTKKPFRKKRDSINQGKKVGVNWFVSEVVYNEKLEDVYDMTVPTVHNFIANDMVVHNCAEEPLPAGGSCLLGSINLSKCVNNKFTNQSEFDFKKFKSIVKHSVIALNEILDEGLELHPLKEQQKSVSDWRQIGLGIMGLADMLIMLGITYGSYDAINICDKIGKLMIDTALATSAELAKDNGSYPKYNAKKVLASEFLRQNSSDETIRLIEKYGLRNSQLLTCAPTGSISTMLGISGGIEPIYAKSYNRTTKSLHDIGDVTYKVYTPIVQEYMDTYSITEEHDLPPYFITSKEIGYVQRIKMQSCWQKYIDASISSTVNLSNESTVNDVYNLYMQAWENGLKGITIYRDGCSRGAILSENGDINEVKDRFDYIVPITKEELGETYGTNIKLKVACGNLYLNVCKDKDGNIVEMFVNTSKGGICQSNINAISRLLSLSLRSGVKVEEIYEQLAGINCPACTIRRKDDKSIGKSCADTIVQYLFDKYNCNETISVSSDKNKIKNICPECKQELHMSEGCVICQNCGFSKCG